MARKDTPFQKKLKPSEAERVKNLVQLFVADYVKHFVASRAYKHIRPDVTEGTADTEGSKYLQTPQVKAELDRVLKERREQLRIDSHYVVAKLHQILESDYLSNVVFMSKRELNKIPPDVRRLVQDVKLVKTKNTNTTASGHESISETETFKVTFMSKDRALELLGKHLGTFARDNDANVNVNIKSFDQITGEIDC